MVIERDGARITVTDASPETAARIVELLAPADDQQGSDGEREGGEDGGAS